ncbi:MAG: type IV pilin protein [Steroidobacteraceae bacterium]
MHKQRGVTLIELVVVMIIVGILAAVAIPSYRNYVLRSQRSDAKDALLALATQQEKYYLQCNTYATVIAGAPNCAAGELQGADTSENGWYDLAIDDADDTSYTLSATAAAGGNQAQDTQCEIFRVTDRGIRTAEDSGGTDKTAECWR